MPISGIGGRQVMEQLTITQVVRKHPLEYAAPEWVDDTNFVAARLGYQHAPL